MQFHLPKIVFDFGAISRLKQELDWLGVKRPMLASDRGLKAAGAIDHVLRANPGVDFVVHADVPENPTAEGVDQTAKLYAYVLRRTGRPVPKEIDEDAESAYGGGDYVAELCALLRSLPIGDVNAIVYGRPKEKLCRELADWWKEHQQADAERELKEEKWRETQRLVESAMSKLTPEEREALTRQSFRQ